MFKRAAVLVVLSMPALATPYYVRENGDDLALGTSDATAWKTLAKVNAVQASLRPGDQVLFRRGDTFVGTLVPTTSGSSTSPITYGAYGSGAKPVFSGFTAVTTWTPVGATRWEAPWPGSLTTLNSFLLNGRVQPIGRYPKTGYLSFESHVGTQQFTDTQLSASPNFTDAEVVIRMVHWLIHRATVTSHAGTTVNFSPAAANSATYPLLNGFGYFFQNSPQTLTANGDWYASTTSRKLGLHFSSTPPTAQVSTVDKLVSIVNTDFLVFSNLDFQGANTRAIDADSISGLTIDGCDFRYAGTHAIRVNYGSDVTLTNNVIRDSFNDAISVSSPNHDNLIIRGNTITNTGMIPGMGVAGGDACRAINVSIRNNALIELNVIRDTGYVPLYFQGSHVRIQHNVIDGFNSVLDDGGGIYTWQGSSPVSRVDRVVEGNLISRGIGAGAGTSNGRSQANGLYLDNNSTDVTLLDNTVFNVVNDGLHANSPQRVTMTRNTFFDVGQGFSFTRWTPTGTNPIDLTNGGQDIVDLNVQDNVVFAKSPGQMAFNYGDTSINYPTPQTLAYRLAAMGTIDANLWHFAETMPFSVSYTLDAGTGQIVPPPMSFGQFKALSGYENAGREVLNVAPYTLGSLVGSNLYPGGQFTSGIAGAGAFSQTPPIHTMSFDGMSKLTGPGSLRIDFSSTGAREYVLVYAPIGPVSAAKKYVFRFSTRGSNEFGSVEATFRQTMSPFGNIASVQSQPFGVARVDDEFLVQPSVDDPGAAWRVLIHAPSGTTWIDDVQVFEVNATVADQLAGLRFEHNDTSAAAVVTARSTQAPDERGGSSCFFGHCSLPSAPALE
jgi:Right handed beta helix region